MFLKLVWIIIQAKNSGDYYLGRMYMNICRVAIYITVYTHTSQHTSVVVMLQDFKFESEWFSKFFSVIINKILHNEEEVVSWMCFLSVWVLILAIETHFFSQPDYSFSFFFLDF